jgi:hypothetical protein
MRVMIIGDDVGLKPVMVNTILNGLYADHKNNLYVIFTGKGETSNVVEDWVDKYFPMDAGRNCLNGEWMIHYYPEEDQEGLIKAFLKEAKPDLIWVIGEDIYNTSKPAYHLDIPVYSTVRI